MARDNQRAVILGEYAKERDALLAKYPNLASRIPAYRQDMGLEEIRDASKDLRNYSTGTYKGSTFPQHPPQTTTVQETSARPRQPAPMPENPNLPMQGGLNPATQMALNGGQPPVTPAPPQGQPATPSAVPSSPGNPPTALNKMTRTASGWVAPVQVLNPSTGQMETRAVSTTPTLDQVVRNNIPDFDQKTPTERAAAIRGMGNSGNVGTVVSRGDGPNPTQDYINSPIGTTTPLPGTDKSINVPGKTIVGPDGQPQVIPPSVASVRTLQPGEALATTGRIGDETGDRTAQFAQKPGASQSNSPTEIAAAYGGAQNVPGYLAGTPSADQRAALLKSNPDIFKQGSDANKQFVQAWQAGGHGGDAVALAGKIFGSASSTASTAPSVQPNTAQPSTANIADQSGTGPLPKVSVSLAQDSFSNPAMKPSDVFGPVKTQPSVQSPAANPQPSSIAYSVGTGLRNAKDAVVGGVDSLYDKASTGIYNNVIAPFSNVGRGFSGESPSPQFAWNNTDQSSVPSSSMAAAPTPSPTPVPTNPSPTQSTAAAVPSPHPAPTPPPVSTAPKNTAPGAPTAAADADPLVRNAPARTLNPQYSPALDIIKNPSSTLPYVAEHALEVKDMGKPDSPSMTGTGFEPVADRNDYWKEFNDRFPITRQPAAAVNPDDEEAKKRALAASTPLTSL